MSRIIVLHKKCSRNVWDEPYPLWEAEKYKKSDFRLSVRRSMHAATRVKRKERTLCPANAARSRKKSSSVDSSFREYSDLDPTDTEVRISLGDTGVGLLMRSDRLPKGSRPKNTLRELACLLVRPITTPQDCSTYLVVHNSVPVKISVSLSTASNRERITYGPSMLLKISRTSSGVRVCWRAENNFVPSFSSGKT